jgi:hypothetical protein
MEREVAALPLETKKKKFRQAAKDLDGYLNLLFSFVPFRFRSTTGINHSCDFSFYKPVSKLKRAGMGRTGHDYRSDVRSKGARQLPPNTVTSHSAD